MKRVIYPVYQFCRCQNVSKHLQNLERTQWLPTDEIGRIQWIKLKKLLEYVYTNVPYYQRVFKALNMTPKDIITSNDFRKLPLLDKDDIRNNIGDIVSSNYEKKDLIKNSTGGSTGVNLDFFNDRKRLEFRTAIVLRNDRWADLDIGDKKAQLWGSPFDIALQDDLKNKILTKMFRTLFLSSYNLSEENMRIYAKQLLQYKPKVIIGYSSPLYLFAKFLEENEIKGIHPKSIISSAEVLTSIVASPYPVDKKDFRFFI